ncbi:MAG: hypothetical protein COZ77_01295 [Gallionellales bacterium CG_4_8_14_3_um_filter_54_18]|nr:MAG: hypothetical protein COZ77_01295 [Gallionellales bacterium CG_4_8_14_3_um_filter_54_18]
MCATGRKTRRQERRVEAGRGAMIKVLFFGPIAAASGARELSIAHSPGMTLGRLKNMLAAAHPEAMRLAVMLAVNGEHARDLAMPLSDNSEVAFMAKFSGG